MKKIQPEKNHEKMSDSQKISYIKKSTTYIKENPPLSTLPSTFSPSNTHPIYLL